jgi:hypothetical protein
LKLGLCVKRRVVEAAALDGQDVVVATIARGSDWTADCGAALDQLAAEGVEIRDAERITVAVDLVAEGIADGLERVALVRLSLPEGRFEEPLIEWPEGLRERVLAGWFVAHGGHEIDGREITPLDKEELQHLAGEVRALGVKGVVVNSPFSPVYPEHELEAKALFEKVLEGVRVYAAHEVGDLGLPYRENAAMLNAAVALQVGRRLRALEQGLRGRGIRATLYLLQNTGLAATPESINRYPVRTLLAPVAAGILGLKTGRGVVAIDLDGEVNFATGVGGLPEVADMIEVPGQDFLVNTGGPLTLRLKPDLPAEFYRRGVEALLGTLPGGEAYALTDEAEELLSRAGVKVKRPRHRRGVGALGAALAGLGLRLVRIFPPGVKSEEAEAAVREDLARGADTLGIVNYRVEVEAKPLTTLPHGASRYVGVLREEAPSG